MYRSFAAYEAAEEFTCPHCGSADVRRRIGRVAIAKSEDSRMDSLADEAMLSQIDENDPRSLGKFMRQMSQEMGEEMGDDFNEVVDRLEKGQQPEEIEQAMPDLADSPPADN